MKQSAYKNAIETHTLKGFTLIEMLIVVAILAVIAAFAVPAYDAYAVKGRRAEGRTALLNMMMEQERYFSQRGVYKEFNSASTAGPFNYYSNKDANDSAYFITAKACDGSDLKTCIKLTATSNPSTKKDPKIATLTYTTSGKKDCTLKSGTTDTSICW